MMFDGLQRGHYGTLLADPPWRFSTYSAKGRDRCPDGIRATRSRDGYYRDGQRCNRPERHYATMTLDEIKALPVAELAAKDCILFLWAVDPMLPEAFEVGRAWGFTYKTVAFYWVKERRVTSNRHKLHEDQNHKRFPIGTGYWTRSNPEQCLLFTRGHPKRLSAAVRKLIIEPRREHSRKPDRLKPDIERLVAGPFLELFSRESRQGWDCCGDQVGQFAEAAE